MKLLVLLDLELGNLGFIFNYYCIFYKNYYYKVNEIFWVIIFLCFKLIFIKNIYVFIFVVIVLFLDNVMIE